MNSSPTNSAVLSTPHGPGRLDYFTADAPGAPSEGVVLLSHGAGKGIEARDLQVLATSLPRSGWTVVLFEQPWRVAGRKVASHPARLDEGLKAAAHVVRSKHGAVRLVIGGRSAGARSAARSATELGAVACLALAFPLHPPGRPESSRAAELLMVGVPTLIVQGSRDPFGGPPEFTDDARYETSAIQLVEVLEADHALAVPRRARRSQSVTDLLLADAVTKWLTRLRQN